MDLRGTCLLSIRILLGFSSFLFACFGWIFRQYLRQICSFGWRHQVHQLDLFGRFGRDHQGSSCCSWAQVGAPMTPSGALGHHSYLDTGPAERTFCFALPTAFTFDNFLCLSCRCDSLLHWTGRSWSRQARRSSYWSCNAWAWMPLCSCCHQRLSDYSHFGYSVTSYRDR